MTELATTPELGTGFQWAIQTLRTTGKNLFDSGMFTRRNLLAQELSINELLELRDTVLARAMNPSAIFAIPNDSGGAEIGLGWAIDTLRIVCANEFKSGMLSIRDVAKLELRIATIEALNALALLLTLVPGETSLDWANDTLRRAMQNRFELGVASKADVAGLELTIAEVRLRELVAAGS